QRPVRLQVYATETLQDVLRHGDELPLGVDAAERLVQTHDLAHLPVRARQCPIELVEDDLCQHSIGKIARLPTLLLPDACVVHLRVVLVRLTHHDAQVRRLQGGPEMRDGLPGSDLRFDVDRTPTVDVAHAQKVHQFV